MTVGLRNRATVARVLVLALLQLACALSAEASPNNHVRIITPTVASSQALPESDMTSRVRVLYYDGLGRPCGEAERWMAGDQCDVACRHVYDVRGNVWRRALPVSVSDESTLARMPSSSWLSAAADYYGDAFPYAETAYDVLGRVTVERGAGEAWRQGGVHTTRHWYLHNLTADDSHGVFVDTVTDLEYLLYCVRYSIDSDGTPRNNGVYATATLRVELAIDADGRAEATFTDKAGRTVLSRRYDEGLNVYDTYYVHDVYGRVRCVIPPKASATLETIQGPCDADVLERLCFRYGYDERDRLVVEKLPGVAERHYVYDKLNRVIFSQDGEQRQAGEWTVTKRDALGRVTLTGRMTAPWHSRATLQSQWGDTLLLCVYDRSQGMEGNLCHTGHTDLPNFTSDRAFFYDTHDFWLATGTALPGDEDYSEPFACHRGVCTGEAVSDYQGGVLVKARALDERGRTVMEAERDVYGNTAMTATFYSYNFTGEVTAKKRVSAVLAEGVALEQHTERWQYVLDNRGRVLTARHRLDNRPWKKILVRTYDGLGRVSTTKLGDRNANTVTRGYNLRGWLTSIDGQHYSQAIYYCGADTLGGGLSLPRYGGDVAATGETRRDGNGQKQWWKQRIYYDGLGQIVKVCDNRMRFSECFAYDENGNVTRIVRGGDALTGDGANDSFDDLTLEYDGNKLVGVTDNAQADSYWGEIPQVPLGEWDDAMEYDLCGRLVRDDTRGVTAVDYIPGGLPQAFHFEGGDRYNSVFTADGVRRGDQTWHPYVEYVMRYDPATGDSVPVPRNRVASASRRFVGGITMVDGHVSRFDNEAGFVTLHGDSAAYHYVFTDRLGSLRAVVDDNGQVEQWVDYHSGGLPSTTATAPMLDDRLHALKPWAAFHGLAFYDNAARWHDPIYCRFHAPDAMAYKAPHLSPFAHCANNPLNALDPSGLDEWYINKNGQVVQQIATNQHDAFFILNNQSEIEKASPMMIHGTVKGIEYLESQGGEPYLKFSISGDKAGKEIFEFLANNTDVEWSQLKTSASTLGENIITTSYSNENEVGAIDMIYTALIPNSIPVREFNHNHPNGVRVPSTTSPKGYPPSEGDLGAAKVMHRLYNGKVNFYIFTKENGYYQYDINYINKGDGMDQELPPVEVVGYKNGKR